MAVLLAGASFLFPGVSSAASTPNSYFIMVSPTSQNPGQTVAVTGEGQYDTPPITGDNCDSTPITVAVTYFTTGGTQKTVTTSLGTSDGDGNITGPVMIPTDAGPSSVTGHNAAVQASCTIGSDTFLSNEVDVVVLGSGTTTTTPTTSPTTTTTTTTTPTSVAPLAQLSTTTTTVPTQTAQPATAVTGTPTFTG